MTRPRGRPRSFDPEQALDRALDVFWSRGFDACSLDDLCTAIGIARPSLYAAFGDKQALYLRAFHKFTERMAGAYRTAMTGTGSFRARSLAYFNAAIDVYTSGSAARGCFAICTAPTDAPEHPAIRHALAEVIAAQDAAFAELVRRACERGELVADPTGAASLLSAVQHTIAVRARAGTPPDQLRQIARAAVTAVFGEPVARPVR